MIHDLDHLRAEDGHTRRSHPDDQSNEDNQLFVFQWEKCKKKSSKGGTVSLLAAYIERVFTCPQRGDTGKLMILCVVSSTMYLVCLFL